ncbi:serine/threonine-protein phosphatase PGAM5, mitochondrial-like [Sorex fumeus]|uniref:serine/threonine-protein phosphatase PGAM5, mitochondrial-like n=1 Tax=Sorex fumeus TaxID=62283 RepID=UPI0024ACE108|nr:serine/threonine-protein phosphatase PGAM5, mitochondrial-like [Sorex fumeus]
MSFRRVLQMAACGLAAGSAALLFSTAAVGKSHMGGDAEFWGAEVPAAKAGSGSSGYGAWDPNWDQRHPPPPPLLPGERGLASGDRATASRHIFLIRHSQYHKDADLEKDRTLTALGRQQAELTGRRLASLGLRFSQIVHSSMTRAIETTDIISKHLPGVQTASTDLLREGFPVEPDPPEPRSESEAARLSKDRARLEAAFQNYIHRADSQQLEDSYEIFICHANVIRYLVCRALQFPPEGWCRLSVRNGSITHLLVRPNGRVVLWTLGDTGFMPPNIVTRS